MFGKKVSETLHWAALADRLRSSLWLVPMGYSVAAMGLALGLIHLDHETEYTTPAWYRYEGQAEGARALLSTIASAMLTISGLVFSITILVLQLASSQFSPRVLRTFLQDRQTQRAMGVLISSFVYAMFVLPQVRSATDTAPEFVPRSAVYVAFVLTLVSVATLIRYIHHMAHSIRAVNVIARVAEETRDSLSRLYPDEFGPLPLEQAALPVCAPDVVLGNQGSPGVVISVDEGAMMREAREHKLLIALVPRVGDFVPRGAPLYRIWGACDWKQLAHEEWVVLSDERTPQQDASFGFRQLVDIAERALSPGINDPTTATQALDQLHDLLRSLAARCIPSSARTDEDGVLRLVLPRPDWPEYVQLSFEEIASYGQGSVQVNRHAARAIRDLLSCVDEQRARPLIRELARFESNERRLDAEASAH